ncbi:MAG TPA: preprotein translocase subunit SecE [Candidatus Hydrogenedens sp.]|nr:preprotein translocase subunit SecE [Candidatus Hydrogenedens sp.]HOK09123.1 preprotein translocase subunit SecE [Candidatus Hydrogenedens sp.]HOL20385.1 preprotein translocase subunit SecE [Candidatus Hydrogenedens sp.]HPP58890.1 preprotein translocase subunit SecE [Candidatus Hydrogenedens sp.]
MSKTVLSVEEKQERGLKALYVKAKNFLLEVKSELEKVTWPTVDDLKVSTKVTMIMLVIMAVIIFAFDVTFAQVMLFILGIAS